VATASTPILPSPSIDVENGHCHSGTSILVASDANIAITTVHTTPIFVRPNITPGDVTTTACPSQLSRAHPKCDDLPLHSSNGRAAQEQERENEKRSEERMGREKTRSSDGFVRTACEEVQPRRLTRRQLAHRSRDTRFSSHFRSGARTHGVISGQHLQRRIIDVRPRDSCVDPRVVQCIFHFNTHDNYKLHIHRLCATHTIPHTVSVHLT